MTVCRLRKRTSTVAPTKATGGAILALGCCMHIQLWNASRPLLVCLCPDVRLLAITPTRPAAPGMPYGTSLSGRVHLMVHRLGSPSLPLVLQPPPSFFPPPFLSPPSWARFFNFSLSLRIQPASLAYR
ncbi:hypothetical protein CYLTODRAFT_416165 [Cylindrobasidium torrendii FP15055 ss-10]|uniref:Uncharacterized protein n=1 Tax=Cylindrobasidium torrendii FP15055 ss-10 TaxID=1314674 RepID=A0A0D7BVQ1_9AGAR|nr:hypothetical protein CYLTODRAFT_416165 [Cylindrobasidium torrendii FP15055 ss-10]